MAACNLRYLFPICNKGSDQTPRLRSSLRKTNYSTVGGGVSNSGSSRLPWTTTSGGSGGGSGGATPTNPTPPDSMHSEDSSYVSARESSSQHSGVSALRVRFSPVAAISGDRRSETSLIDIPVHGQTQDYTIPLKVMSGKPSIKPSTHFWIFAQAARPVRRDCPPASRSSKSAMSELDATFYK